ncbi:MAG TPA: hypothetical protein P5218_10570 [Planctomycetota bacterium]|nr:hypothetical protein [Planctomycetota bacterium]
MKYTLFAGLLLAAPALATPQFAVIDNPDEVYASPPEPGPVITDPFHTMVSGDFDGDRVKDVAFLSGSTLSTLLDPDSYDVIHHTSIVANSIVSVPNNADRDEHCLLLAQAGGLQTAEWVNGTWVTASVQGANLPEVTALEVRATGAGILVTGLGTDGLTVYAIGTTDSYVSASTTWTSYGSFTATAPIADFQLLDWDTTAGAEIALAYGSNLEVRALPLTSAPALYATNLGAFEVTHLGRIFRNNYVRDLLAVVTRTTAGAEFISVYAPTGVKSTIDVSAAGGIADLATADYDRNGNFDLILSLADTYGVGILLASDAMTPTYDFHPVGRIGQPMPSASLVRIAPGVVPSVAPTSPGVLDVDGDGDLDLLAMTGTNQRLHLYREVAVVDHHLYTSGLRYGFDLDLVEIATGGQFTFDMRVPEQIDVATHLQISLFTKNGLSAPVVAQPSATMLVAWSGIPSGTEFLPVTQTVPGVSLATHTNIVFVKVQQVHVDQTGKVRLVYPASHFAFHALGRSANPVLFSDYSNWIAQMPGSGTATFYVQDPTVSGLRGAEKDGSGHEVACIPLIQ